MSAAVVLRILKSAGWAPAAVVVLHAFVIRSPYHAAMDNLIHFLGGASIAFFARRALDILEETSPLSGGIKYAFAFTAACATALWWEIGEFASDRLFGTQVQENLIETMADLIAGVFGALGVLGLMASICTGRK